MHQVSVIIPTRNRPGLLRCAVESVLAQTLQPHEIIVVDDASRNAEAVRRITGLSPLVRLHRNAEPRGPAAARNVGLDAATGDFVLFLDDDDVVHPRYFEDASAVLASREDAGVAVFLFECFYAPGADGVAPMALLFDYEASEVHPVRRAIHSPFVSRFVIEERTPSSFLRYLVPIHSCFVRRSTIGDLRFPEDLRQGEDTYFWIALCERGCRFVWDPRVYAYIRRHSGNMTRSRREYLEHIPDCYRALLAARLLRDPQDVVLAHIKLFTFTLRTRPASALRHLAAALSRPGYMLSELQFWRVRLRERKRLLDYYLAP